MMNTHLRTLLALGATLASAGTVAMLSGCRGERSDEPPHQFLPDMDDSPKFKNQGQTEFFQDGRMMRQPVKGTVPFGESSDAANPTRKTLLKASAEASTGIDPAGKPDAEGQPSYVRLMPASVITDYTEMKAASGQNFADDGAAWTSMIQRGQERFGIYCAVCHGLQGEGGDPANFSGGIVGRRWNYPVPSLMDAKYRDRETRLGRDGYIFNVIRNGVPDLDPTKPHKMPPYRDKISEADSWAIVAYVRTLQAAWNEGKPSATTSAAASSEVKP
jgi:mono/diheme cytochrome c family protein